jgi:hypothetical protein
VASFVFLPTLVIWFGERRAALCMMCLGLSGFLLMGTSGPPRALDRASPNVWS